MNDTIFFYLHFYIIVDRENDVCDKLIKYMNIAFLKIHILSSVRKHEITSIFSGGLTR